MYCEPMAAGNQVIYRWNWSNPGWDMWNPIYPLRNNTTAGAPRRLCQMCWEAEHGSTACQRFNGVNWVLDTSSYPGR